MLRILGWSLLIGLAVTTGVMLRMLVVNRRIIRQLQADLHEATEIDAVLRRTSPDNKDRRHLRLLALVPPAAWLAAHVGRRQVAVAAAAASAVFTAGTLDLHDGPRHPHMTPPAAEATGRPAPTVAQIRPVAAPRPPAVPAATTTTITAPAATSEQAQPAAATTTTALSMTTTAAVEPLAEVSTTVTTGGGCLLEAELLGLDVAAVC